MLLEDWEVFDHPYLDVLLTVSQRADGQGSSPRAGAPEAPRIVSRMKFLLLPDMVFEVFWRAVEPLVACLSVFSRSAVAHGLAPGT